MENNVIEDEIWKDIPGYEGRYQASTLGRIRSTMRQKPHVLTLHTYKNSPYYKVLLINAEGRRKWHRAHRLVYITFIGPIPEGLVIDHISGDRLDNSVSNLRATTVADNCRNPNTIMNYRNRKHSPEEFAHRSEGQKRRFQRADEKARMLLVAAKGREVACRNREQRRNQHFAAENG